MKIEDPVRIDRPVKDEYLGLLAALNNKFDLEAGSQFEADVENNPNEAIGILCRRDLEDNFRIFDVEVAFDEREAIRNSLFSGGAGLSRKQCFHQMFPEMTLKPES